MDWRVEIKSKREKLPNSEGENPHNSLFCKKPVDKQFSLGTKVVDNKKEINSCIHC